MSSHRHAAVNRHREACEPGRVQAGRSQHHPLVWVFVFAALGIWGDRSADLWPGLWSSLAGAALLVWLLLYACRWHAWSCAALLVSVTGLAGLWHQERWEWFPADEIARYAGADPVPVCVRVIALDASRFGPGRPLAGNRDAIPSVTTMLAVRAVAVRQGSQWQPVSGRVLLRVDGRVPDVLRGDTLQVAGLLERVPTAANPGEPDFAAMRRGSRELAALYCRHVGGVDRIAVGVGWHPWRLMGRWRLEAERILERHIGPARADLAAALLLGSREKLDRSVRHTFFLTGTMHLLAISGLHVGILAAGLWCVLRLDWFPRPITLLLIAVLAVGYAALTGGKPPVTRATVLILIYCLARWLGRPRVAWNGLAAAALVTLARSPGGLFDTGTQLSFLAVATLIARWGREVGGMAATTDPLDRLLLSSQPAPLRWLRAAGQQVWGTARAGTAIWLVTSPLVAHQFHLISPVGLVLNLALWVPLAVALFAGAGTLVTAPIPLAPVVLGRVADAALYVMHEATSLAARPAWGHVWTHGPSTSWLVGFYAILAARQFWPRLVSARGARGWLLAWLAAGMWGPTVAADIRQRLGTEPLRVSFIAVGHGTSVLIEPPGGSSLLYDAGRMGDPETAPFPIAASLWARGVSRIDALILSHADADHFNAVPGLLDRFSIATVYVSAKMFDPPTPGLTQLRQRIDAAGIPVVVIGQGDRLHSACGVQIDILHPSRSHDDHDARLMADNEQSIVVGISYQGVRILLTGDIEGNGLEELLAEEPWPTHVLLAPHHGSRHSRPADVLQWANPSLVVVSAGGGPRVEQDLAAYRREDVTLVWTHREGLVEVQVDSAGLRHRSWRSGRW